MSDEELIARLRDWPVSGMTNHAAADRIEALTEQLAAAQHDAKEAEAYAEGLERELRDTQDRANAFATKEYYTEMRAERAEAKLAKAVEALRNCPPTSNPTISAQEHVDRINAWWRLEARATLAEIKGESQDGMV